MKSEVSGRQLEGRGGKEIDDGVFSNISNRLMIEIDISRTVKVYFEKNK